jgi:hypothetical protein
MTTKRKQGSRRLALSVGKGLSADLSFMDWATGGKDLRALAADLGRGHYLRALSKTGRFVLSDLRNLGEQDHLKLQAWARR